jgi:hypothetical protein
VILCVQVETHPSVFVQGTSAARCSPPPRWLA